MMGYNGGVMSVSASDVYQRLVGAARAVDPALVVDRGSIHWIDHPYPGLEYGLAIDGAHAVFFLLSADIAGPGWEGRLPGRLEAACQYLRGFPARAR
jgi:hypothetical protein